MDYKYIEQLLERYWNCETTLEEEDILRTFFSQKEVPAHLLRYRSLFTYEQTIKKARLSDDFDEKILKLIESEEAPSISLYTSMFFAPKHACRISAIKLFRASVQPAP